MLGVLKEHPPSEKGVGKTENDKEGIWVTVDLNTHTHTHTQKTISNEILLHGPIEKPVEWEPGNGDPGMRNEASYMYFTHTLKAVT